MKKNQIERSRVYGINIRVTRDEKKHITRNAKRCKLSVSEYLRQLGNGYEPKELPNDALYDLCQEIELMREEYGRYSEEYEGFLIDALTSIRKLCDACTAPEVSMM